MVTHSPAPERTAPTVAASSANAVATLPEPFESAPVFSRFTGDAEAALRLAWQVTIAATLALVIILVGGPALRRWYVSTAVEARAAHMQAIDGGVVFLQRLGAGDWLMAKANDVIAPGDVLRTAANSRAFITLFDHSTVLLYPSSTVRVMRAEQGRFRPEKTAIVLDLTQGRARIGVAPPASPEDAFFQLRAASAEVHLQEGSYSADVSKEGSQVSVRVGQATAYTPRGAASANTGQRLAALPGQAPLGNLPARRDLLANGLFTQRDAVGPAGWVVRDVSEQEPSGTVSLDKIPGAVAFERAGRGHGETLISQQLDVDLWDYEKLTLSANVRVLSQSLSGGGWLGREFPLVLRVIYRDATGGVVPWYHGLYLQNADNNPALDAEQLPSTDWHRVDIDLLSLAPRPWRIQRVEVVAMGWDYTSAIGELHLWAE